jgi:MFS family permease
VSGVAQSAMVVGSALFAIPATAIVNRYGRRPSLATGYLVAVVGGVVVVASAVRGSVPLLFAGFFLFGGASAANFQSRYAAVDLAPAQLRGRHLSLIVWASTLGAIVGPNLAGVAGATLEPYGIPTLAGPFLFSALLLGLNTALLVLLLRPDPAVVARATLSPATSDTPTVAAGGIRDALRFVLGVASARLGIAAMAIGHVVMIGVMAMTPVHIRSAGHAADHTLRIVGIVLSFHIAGMFAFSPVFGWLTDKLGRRQVILIGIALLLTACAISGTAGHGQIPLAVGMMTLGLGWSATMVAGSTLLSDSVPTELRASAQGLSDLVMGLAGATAGALSGVILEVWSYAILAAVAAAATLPLVLLLLIARTAIAAGGARERRTG